MSAELRAQCFGDFREATLAIQQASHQVEQTREVDDLAIIPADQVGGLLVGRALILAEQLCPFPELQLAHAGRASSDEASSHFRAGWEPECLLEPGYA